MEPRCQVSIRSVVCGSTLLLSVLSAGEATLFPFLSVFFRYLGFTAVQTGLLLCAKAVFGLLAFGYFSYWKSEGRWRNSFAMCTIFMTIISFCVLSLMPPSDPRIYEALCSSENSKHEMLPPGGIVTGHAPFLTSVSHDAQMNVNEQFSTTVESQSKTLPGATTASFHQASDDLETVNVSDKVNVTVASISDMLHQQTPKSESVEETVGIFDNGQKEKTWTTAAYDMKESENVKSFVTESTNTEGTSKEPEPEEVGINHAFKVDMHNTKEKTEMNDIENILGKERTETDVTLRAALGLKSTEGTFTKYPQKFLTSEPQVMSVPKELENKIFSYSDKAFPVTQRMLTSVNDMLEKMTTTGINLDTNRFNYRKELSEHSKELGQEQNRGSDDIYESIVPYIGKTSNIMPTTRRELTVDENMMQFQKYDFQTKSPQLTSQLPSSTLSLNVKHPIDNSYWNVDHSKPSKVADEYFDSRDNRNQDTEMKKPSTSATEAEPLLEIPKPKKKGNWNWSANTKENSWNVNINDNRDGYRYPGSSYHQFGNTYKQKYSEQTGKANNSADRDSNQGGVSWVNSKVEKPTERIKTVSESETSFKNPWKPYHVEQRPLTDTHNAYHSKYASSRNQPSEHHAAHPLPEPNKVTGTTHASNSAWSWWHDLNRNKNSDGGYKKNSNYLESFTVQSDYAGNPTSTRKPWFSLKQSHVQGNEVVKPENVNRHTYGGVQHQHFENSGQNTRKDNWPRVPVVPQEQQPFIWETDDQKLELTTQSSSGWFWNQWFGTRRRKRDVNDAFSASDGTVEDDVIVDSDKDLLYADDLYSQSMTKENTEGVIKDEKIAVAIHTVHSFFTTWSFTVVLISLSVGSLCFTPVTWVSKEALYEFLDDSDCAEKYRVHRLWSVLVAALSVFTVGKIVDSLPCYIMKDDIGKIIVHFFAFYVIIGVAFIILFCTVIPERDRPRKQSPAELFMRTFYLIFQNKRMACGLAIVSLIGFVESTLQNFLFWKMQDLGGSESSMAAVVAVGLLAHIPVHCTGKVLVRKLGCLPLMSLAVAALGVKALYLGFLWAPWAAVPAQLTWVLTSGLWTAVDSFSDEAKVSGLKMKVCRARSIFV